MTTSDEPTPPPAETTEAESVPPKTAGGFRYRLWAGLAIIILVLAGLAAGAGYLAWPRIQARWQGVIGHTVASAPAPAPLTAQVADLRRRLDSTQAEVTALKTRLDSLAATSSETATAAPAKPEQTGAGGVSAQQLAALSQRIDHLQRNSVDPATVLRLSMRLDKAEATLRQMAAARTSAAALLLSTIQLREAVDRAAPFDSELRALSVLATGSENGDIAAGIKILKPYAGAGIPARAALIRRFRALEPALIRADWLPSDAGWFDRALARLAGIVSIRRENGEAAGDSVAAIAARVAARLKAGDLADAIREAAALKAGAKTLAAPWLAQARARLAADRALSAMVAQAVAETAAGTRSDGGPAAGATGKEP